ncbi:MAG: T9SS type A sorting domain-containing protein [Taibaiella sp.]|jgi:hypothetical protein
MKKNYPFKRLWQTGKALTIATAFLATAATSQAQVSSYTFSQTNGTYTPITGGTILAQNSGTTTFDTDGWPVTLPFSFTFNGNPYTSAFVNSNGGMTFGTTTSTGSAVISSSTAYSGAIAAMNRDLWGMYGTAGTRVLGDSIITGVTSFVGLTVGATIQGTGIPTGATVEVINQVAGTIEMSAAATANESASSIRWPSAKVLTQTLGTAPNRVFVIEWSQFADYNFSGLPNNTNLNFQVTLEETTNKINVIYGTNTTLSTTSRTQQVGLRGAANTDYNNRTSATSWSTTTAGASNSATVTRTNTITPTSGLTFTWSPPLCVVPGNVTVPTANITTSTATINWSVPSPTPADYQWEVRSSGAAGSGASGLASNGTSLTNTTSASGLAPSTTYSVYVRSNCGANGNSSWTTAVTFMTLCVNFTVPFTQDFNAGAMPICWANSNTSNSTSTNSFWKFTGSSDYGTTPAINGRPAGTYAWVDASSPYVDSVTLTTPNINLTGLAAPYIQFDWFKNNTDPSSTALNNVFRVDVNSGTGWVNVFSNSTNSTSWRIVGITLPASYVNATIQVRFVVNKTSSNNFYDDALLDNVSVIEAPSCFPPTALTIPSATLTPTSASFSWTAPVTGTPSGYEWEIRTSGLPGSGATGLAANGASATVNASNATLTANTAYTLYVRSQCGASFSDWSAAQTFNTPCAAYTTPFLETFEGTTFVPTCWSQASGSLAAPTVFGTTNNYWNQQNYGDASVTVSTSANKAARINIYTTNRRDWLITPPINLGAAPKQLEFDIALTEYNSATASILGVDDTVAVVISTDNGATWSSANILQQWGSTTPIANGAGNHAIINLSAYTGVIKIGFYGASTVSNADIDIFIDNVKIDVIPDCQVPLNLAANTITTNSANISWSPSTSTSPAGYQWEVRTSGLPGSGATGLVASGSTTTPTVTASVAGLQPVTTYSAYVRTSCGSSFSAWSSASNFTTLCAAYTVPFLETFEGTTFVPSCWSQASGSLAAPTVFGTTNNYWNQQNYGDASVTVGTSANKAARINIYSTSRKDWLITPSINLGTTPKQLEFDIALTEYYSNIAATLGVDDTVAVVISTDNGATWSSANILQQWGSTTLIANTGNHITIDLTPYTGVVKIGFYGASTVSNEDIDVFIDNVSVVANTCPTVNLGANVVACNTGSFSQILNAGNPGATYLWDNATTAQTRTVTTAGTYFVDVTVGTCTRRDSIVITLNPLPVVALGNDTAICSGSTLTLNAGNAGATYLWSNASTTQTTTVSAAGTYYVTVTGTNTCIGRDTLVLTINANPVVDLGNDTAICTGNTLTLNASATGTSYLWDDASTLATRDVTTAGSFYVTVTDANACTGSDTVSVTMYALPIVDLGSDTSICNGTTLTLDAGTAGTTYLWDDASTAQTRDVATAGNFYVTITDANGCNAADSVNVAIIAPPIGSINITSNGNGAFTFTVINPQNVTSSAWNFGDQTTGAGSTVQHTYTANGNYTITLTLTGECGDTVITQTLNVGTVVGIDQLALGNDELMLYPNPAKATLNITNKSGLDMKKISAYNILGQLVYQAQTNSKDNHQINISGFASGVYTLKIETEKGIVVRKFEVLQ